MRTLTDIQQRILKEEYPYMSLDTDSDVERYFELRSAGRQGDALAYYNRHLKQKYPDEEQRTLIIRYYRSHDPRFADILRDNLVLLADRIIKRTTAIISFLTKDIDSVDMSDAYSVIKMVEGLLAVISPDRYVAISFTEKYVRYAKRLDFKFGKMERTAELIRLYVTDTLESVEEFKRDKEAKRKQQAHRQTQHKKQQANFDLSSIVFSPADTARILIPDSIARTEDVVIAYCLKYWNMTGDPAFEKSVFLYSRKFRTRNNDIFQAIKNGRQHNWKDEEILNAVLGSVVTGYYYNISGDLYIQRTWARTKAAVLGREPLPETMPAPAVRRTKKVRAARQKKKPETQKPVVPFKARSVARQRANPELPRPPSIAPNSIADMIKKLTGKTYTVYKDLFFRSVGPSIRQVLVSSKSRKGTLFDNKQNAAEELIYTFLLDNYTNPYQNWKECPEQKQVAELGYSVANLEPIIAGWVQENHS